MFRASFVIILIMNFAKLTTLTLFINVLLLSLMVPGGPVETRSFINIDPAIVLGFNIILTLLVLLSVASIYFMFKKQRWAYQLTGVLGFVYALVFVLDLAHIFPVSSDPMELVLLLLEWISLGLGVALIGLSYKTLSNTHASYWSSSSRIPVYLLVLSVILLLFGACVVYFATNAALVS